ncbi:MAG: aminoacyl-tRNA hydrolase [Tenericutes bacterium]|jgi:PTH1 family peptidyl-tRNA hydrolase|nr:aminoacyl-tRNA hydrolase [Mycoplasmatota bacterium]
MKKLVVGLGNPGRKYKNSKHNIGFMALDHYANNAKIKFKKKSTMNAEVAEDGDLILAKPLTFMNLSGIALRKIVDYYNIDNDQVLVIYDDVDLPFAKLRLRYKGGAGGHNGIKSIIQHLNSQDFNRIRFGIDKSERVDMKDYVLSNFSKTEFKTLKDVLIDMDRIIYDFKMDINFDEIMNKYN